MWNWSFKKSTNFLVPIWLYFAHGQSIWNISEDGKNFQLARMGLQKTAMLDVDVKVYIFLYLKDPASFEQNFLILFKLKVQVGAINFCVGSKFQIVHPSKIFAKQNCIKSLKCLCIETKRLTLFEFDLCIETKII